MGKLAYEQGSYGEYLLCLMKEHKFSSSEFAKLINVSRTYLYDLFHGRVKPPSHEMQGLSGDEKEEFYNRTAAGRGELPKDVFEYLYNNADEISMVRERMRYDNG